MPKWGKYDQYYYDFGVASHISQICLHRINVDTVILHLLVHCNQQFSIRQGNIPSNLFQVSNGVQCQGCIMLTVLFIVCMNELSETINVSKTKTGYHLN